MTSEIWAIVLAAGKSTRMQQQKLLMPFRGETIVSKVVNTARLAAGDNVVVVLGSHSEEVREQVGNENLKFCFNPDYERGMLSSVICGFNGLPETAGAALLFLGDQPQIPAAVSLAVIEAWKTSGKGIIIPASEGKKGHPVLIEIRYRKEIEQLNPEKGLRSLMEKFSSDVHVVECSTPEILRDIDTPADYENEINKLK